MEIKELLAMKEKLVKKRTAKDTLLGKKSTLIDQLKEMGFTCVTEAKNALEEMDKELLNLEEKLLKEVNAFKETYKDLLA